MQAGGDGRDTSNAHKGIAAPKTRVVVHVPDVTDADRGRMKA